MPYPQHTGCQFTYTTPRTSSTTTPTPAVPYPHKPFPQHAEHPHPPYLHCNLCQEIEPLTQHTQWHHLWPLVHHGQSETSTVSSSDSMSVLTTQKTSSQTTSTLPVMTPAPPVEEEPNPNRTTHITYSHAYTVGDVTPEPPVPAPPGVVVAPLSASCRRVLMRAQILRAGPSLMLMAVIRWSSFSSSRACPSISCCRNSSAYSPHPGRFLTNSYTSTTCWGLQTVGKMCMCVLSECM